MEQTLKKLEDYKPKDVHIRAEHLDCDVKIRYPNQMELHMSAGNYLIQTPDGKIYPAVRELFEYLFEKCEETNEAE